MADAGDIRALAEAVLAARPATPTPWRWDPASRAQAVVRGTVREGSDFVLQLDAESLYVTARSDTDAMLARANAGADLAAFALAVLDALDQEEARVQRVGLVSAQVTVDLIRAAITRNLEARRG